MDKDFKILVVTNMYPDKKHPSYGVFVENFCKQLTANEIAFDIVYINKKDSKFKKMYSYLKFIIKAFLRCIYGNYNYIYIHYLSVSSIPVLLALHFKRLKIISNAHGTDFIPQNKKQERYQKYTRKILSHSEKLVVPSEYFEAYAKQKYTTELNNKKIYVYPSGGIDSKVFYPIEEDDLKDLYKKYNLDINKIYLGYCGRISANKGIDTLLYAIQLVVKEQKNTRFIIAGSGEYEIHMQELIDTLGLNNYIIRFPLIPQHQLNEIYNLLQIFIFPTEGDSLGLVAIEAMACGNVVIASDYAAPKYYIEDGVNGFKFEKGNYTELASLILKYIHNDKIHEQLKEGALKTALLYTTEHIKDQLLIILGDNND